VLSDALREDLQKGWRLVSAMQELHMAASLSHDVERLRAAIRAAEDLLPAGHAPVPILEA